MRLSDMSSRDIARMVFEDKDDDFIEFVLWEKIGFQSFWRIPEDGTTPQECLLRQLLDFKITMNLAQLAVDTSKQA